MRVKRVKYYYYYCGLSTSAVKVALVLPPLALIRKLGVAMIYVNIKLELKERPSGFRVAQNDGWEKFK